MSNCILQEINDVYFISSIIKTINPNFKLFYNTIRNCYEVHNFSVKPSLIISYQKYPDYKLIEKLYKTNRNNMKKLFQEIEENNKKLEIKQNNSLLDKSKIQLNEILNYQISNPGKNLSLNQIKNILEQGDLKWQKMF